MTNKEKIRAEVERLRKSYQIMYQELDYESPELISVCAKRNLCQDILMFIDSMQEEPYVMSDKGKFTTTTKQHRKENKPKKGLQQDNQSSPEPLNLPHRQVTDHWVIPQEYSSEDFLN